MGSPRVVLVNPDPFEKELLRRLFQSRDYRVTIAVNEDAAFGVVKRTRPDVVVISDRRKDSHCARLTRRIRDAPGLAAVGVLTLVRNEDMELAVRCYEAGADTVLFTPTDLDFLCLTVQAVLRRATLPAAPAAHRADRTLAIVPEPAVQNRSA
jgi:DNA-binding response OmpR family regulator